MSTSPHCILIECGSQIVANAGTGAGTETGANFAHNGPVGCKWPGGKRVKQKAMGGKFGLGFCQRHQEH